MVNYREWIYKQTFFFVLLKTVLNNLLQNLFNQLLYSPLISFNTLTSVIEIFLSYTAYVSPPHVY